VTYLLDVNALLALGYSGHVHHLRVMCWLRHLHAVASEPVWLATCAITELGFVRIASGAAALTGDVQTAQAELYQLKQTNRVVFLPDQVSADALPDWVRKSAQTTDGHLMQLAALHRLRFATLDERIPGAELIPAHLNPPWMVREPAMSYGSAA
jgi:predicted nucleic acid-binding protein